MSTGISFQFIRSVCRLTSLLAVLPTLALGAMTISKKPTKNVTCTATVCSATSKKAVLNAKQLMQLLKKNDVAIVPGSVAESIVVDRALHWTSAHRLTLDAFSLIAINQPIVIEGTGALTLTTNDGGSGGDYSFGANGNVQFLDTASGLTINGTTFTLVADLPTLIADITSAHGSGAYALARSYDASADGTYSHAAILTSFAGIFEGLGNAVENLDINDPATSSNAALFSVTTASGVLRDVSLANISVAGAANTMAALVGVSNGAIKNIAVSGQVQSAAVSGDIGGIAAVLEGTMASSSSTASVQGGVGMGNLFVGGLVGEMFGGHAMLSRSFAAGTVLIDMGGYAGGLVGGSEDSGDSIQQCYATAQVTAGGTAELGGLVGLNHGPITETFAIGAVTAGNGSDVGGLIGENHSTINQSYSIGSVSAGLHSFVGGLIGTDNTTLGSLSDTYWDTDTSGIGDLTKGAGNRKDDQGITGLTTAQLQSGLPAGFDPLVWNEAANINGGLPYLLALPGP